MSLANTTWTFTLMGGSSFTGTFEPNGIIKIGSTLFTWGESNLGNFVMQAPNIYGTDAQIYFGLVQGNHAGGCYTNGKPPSAPYEISWFSMTPA